VVPTQLINDYKTTSTVLEDNPNPMNETGTQIIAEESRAVDFFEYSNLNQMLHS